MARFDNGQNKKQELPVKKSGSDGVTAGKTVTRPIHKWTIHKGPLPVNKDLHPLVQKHAAGTATINVTSDGHHRFQTKNNTSAKTAIPIHSPEPKLVNACSTATNAGREVLMKPRRKLVIRRLQVDWPMASGVTGFWGEKVRLSQEALNLIPIKR